jgi:single stranded DNA-binding protein
MASYNRVVLLGNCTRDPEVKYTPKGTAVTELGLAVNRYYSTDGGEKREETTFVDVTLWGRPAEIAGEYIKKGRPVMIEGRLQLDTWDDKQTGQKRSKLKVIGENLQLLGAHQHRCRSAVAGNRDPFVLLLHAIHHFRELGFHFGKRKNVRHDQNNSQIENGRDVADGLPGIASSDGRFQPHSMQRAGRRTSSDGRPFGERGKDLAVNRPYGSSARLR